MWASRPRDDARARSGGGLRGGGAGSLLIEIKVIILNRRVWFGATRRIYDRNEGVLILFKPTCQF
jgi:hypothetical protein